MKPGHHFPILLNQSVHHVEIVAIESAIERGKKGREGCGFEKQAV